MLHYWLTRVRLKIKLLRADDKYDALVEKRKSLLRVKTHFPRYECSDYLRDLDSRIALAQAELDLAAHRHRVHMNMRRRKVHA
ncbi:MAG TPA: hypothetical protein VFI84_01530 [Candidatus Saccharimonadales bacterium]|nr:hypothetical protein [Candidatus Saccharimonadales bacterium]